MSGGFRLRALSLVVLTAISVTLATQVELDEQESRVEQHLIYHVAYQPTDYLVLGVPRAIRSDRLKVSLDGQRLLPVLMRERIDAGDAKRERAASL